MRFWWHILVISFEAAILAGVVRIVQCANPGRIVDSDVASMNRSSVPALTGIQE